MDAPAPDVIGEARQGTADPDLEPRFRILKRGDWRRAFRLEGIFWTILERAAKERGLKLTDYVRLILAVAGESTNHASYLRAHAASWLRGQLVERERRLRESDPAQFLKAVPVPGFTIAEGRGLVAYNGEFINFVRRIADKSSIARVSDARLTLDAPLARIVETLQESRRAALECGFQLLINDQRMRGRVRVTLVPGLSQQPDIMGFITTVERARSSAS